MVSGRRVVRGFVRCAPLGGVAALTLALLYMVSAAADRREAATRSPYAVAWSPDGTRLAATDRTAGELLLMRKSGEVMRRVPLRSPAGLVWSASGDRVLVAEADTGHLAEIQADSGRVVRRTRVGKAPESVALAGAGGLVVVTCRASRTVVTCRLREGRVLHSLRLAGEPFGIACTSDGSLAVVTELLPTGDATRTDNAASVALLRPATGARLARIRLPAGGTVVRGVDLSPDGRWAYVAHALGRYNLPTTHLDRGWVNTNAVTILDLRARRRYATVLLDLPSAGGADLWGLTVSRDGGSLWVALSGVHEVARLDLRRLHAYLEGRIPADSPLLNPSEEYSLSAASTWKAIRDDPARRTDLAEDLSALHAAGILERFAVKGRGPRGIALSSDGANCAAACYYSGTIVLFPAASPRQQKVCVAGPLARETAEREGERLFHDAGLAFQGWLSCATCHPDGRADGLNWDLLNDGVGNPKNTRSLVWAPRTPPMMSHAVRPTLDAATVAGFRFIEFREPTARESRAVQAYLNALQPARSPYRTDSGGLTPAAERGRRIFHSRAADCARCHPPPLYTDLRSYDVGTRGKADSGGKMDTPTLVELWRTGPYLHDGRAPTLLDVLTRQNRGDRHGRTSHLSREQLRDLVEYLLSL